MKVTDVLAASVIIPAALARGMPHRNVPSQDNGGALEQYARVTAFVIDEQGRPRVECREIGSSSQRNGRQGRDRDGRDGSRGVYSATLIPRGSDEVGVDVISFAPGTQIYPPQSRNNELGSSGLLQVFQHPCFFRVNSGIAQIRNMLLQNNMTAQEESDDNGQYIFAPENGDDMFYLEDQRQQERRSSNNDEQSLVIETASGGHTQLLGITHSGQTEYKKLHDGRCSYTGVEVDPQRNGRDGRNGRNDRDGRDGRDRDDRDGRDGRDDGKHINLNLQIEEL